MTYRVRKQLSWLAAGLAVFVVIWQGTLVSRAQKAQHAAEMRWQLSISGSLNGMFDCRFVGPVGENVVWADSEAWYSPHFMWLLGYDVDTRPDDGSLCTFLDLVYEEDRNRLEQLLVGAIRDKEQVQTEFRARHADGSCHWYLLSAVGTHNHVQRVSGSILDITHAKEEQRRSDLIILSSPEAIIVCDADKNVVLANAATEEMFGWTADELKGKPIDRLITKQYLAKHASVFAMAMQRLRSAPDNWQIRKSNIKGGGVNRSGVEFPVLLHVRGIKYLGKIEFIATIQRHDDHGPECPVPESLPLPQQQQSWQLRREADMVRVELR